MFIRIDYIEFYVRPADINDNNTAVKTLGMYLTADTADLSNNLPSELALHHLVPQIKDTAEYYDQVSGWTKISGYFTPSTSGVKHVIIGNFDPEVNNGEGVYQLLPGHSGSSLQSYYFIDAVYIAPANQGIPNLGPAISGPDAICYSGSAVTVSNLPFGSTVTWTTSPSNILTPSSGTGTTANISAVNHFISEEGTVTFQIDGICDQNSISQDFTVGHPSPIIGPFSGPSTVNKGTINNKYSVPAQDVSDGTVVWIRPVGFILQGSWTSTYPYALFQIGTGSRVSSGYVQIWKNNACGNGGAQFMWVTVEDGGCDPCTIVIQVTPNPVVNELDIKYADKETTELLTYDEFDLPVEYVVTDYYGNVVFSKSSNKTKHKLSLSSIREGGTYILSAYYGDGSGVEQIRLIIER